jgi:cytochrome c553
MVPTPIQSYNAITTTTGIPSMQLRTASLLLIIAGLSACDLGTTPPPAQPQPTAAPVSHEITLVSGCNSCHGIDGVGNNPDVPFIAGQHAEYLESALRAYLIGDRKHDIMRAAVFDLEGSERRQLAEHFAQLDSSWKNKTPNKPTDDEADNARDIRAGRSLSKPCAGCHGTDGNSSKEGVPSLAGLQSEYFIPALKSYLQGKRRGAAIMKNFKLSLSQRDMRQLAAFFAVQKRQTSPLGNRYKASDASDALAGRCLGCHGDDGNSTHPAMPSLAGQNAAYLMKAMQTYRDKKRQNKMMVDVAQDLSDEAIRRNAIYFATRTPVNTSNAKTTASRAFTPLTDGEKLAASCNGCHGDKGNSRIPGTPRLAGLAQAYLQTAIADYRNGKRQQAMMQTLSRYLSDTDIEKIALYYASQIPATNITKTDASAEKLAGACAGCHGENGNSENVNIPSLAGQDAAYIVAALNAYQNDRRQHSDMKSAAQALNKQAKQVLGEYYSKLEAKPPAVRQMEAPEILAQKCDRCHGTNGKKPDADKPRIAGQRRDYLINAISAYKNKQRINSMMYKMTAELSRVEIEAIADYYSNR